MEKTVIAFLFSLTGIIACVPGRYGEDCKLFCPENCLHKECQKLNGKCNLCSTGWMGSYCDISCIKGAYGKDCAFLCGGHCKNGCNHVNGKCDYGCEPGWYTDDCNKECSNSSYGAECKLICGHCRNGVSCHHVTGQCMTGCEPGYTGQNCNNVCSDGRYGDKCEKTCGKDAKCNHVTGECCGSTELRTLVKEKEDMLDNKNDVVIGLAVPLSLFILVSAILACCLYIRNCD